VTAVTLTRIGAGELPVVERLWQLYSHDMSQFRGTYPDEAGLFRWGRLPSYLDTADRCGYLVRRDGSPAGFAFVRGLQSGPLVMGDFFVVRAARRTGVGGTAAHWVLTHHPGEWQIPFQEENPGAARFWREVASVVAGADWSEDRRPVPGKPDLPPDVWITLRSW
jgi:predicted acetyltransferase